MTNRAQQVLEQALELDRQERAALTARLLRSLDEGEELGDEEWEAVWGAELDRRVRSVEDGTAVLVPAEVVLSRVQAMLDAAEESR